jgi:hypothetical protein
MIIGISGYAKAGKDTIGRIIQYMHCKNVGDIGLEEMLKYYDNHEWWLEDQSGWEIKKYAGKLKQIASLLTGIPVESFEDQEVKNSYLNCDWNHDGKRMLVIEFLQKLGTESIRDIIHPNAWVLALMSDYKPSYERDIYKHNDGQSTASLRKDGLLEKELLEKENWNLINTFSDGFPKWIVTDVRFPNEAKAIKDRGGIIIRVDRPGIKPINPHPSETALDNWEFDYKIANVSDFKALAFTVQTILEKT